MDLEQTIVNPRRDEGAEANASFRQAVLGEGSLYKDCIRPISVLPGRRDRTLLPLQLV